jgi:hypothetical protein
MDKAEQEIITGPLPLSDLQTVYLDQEWSDYDYPDDMAQKYPPADHYVTWQHFAVLEDLSQEILEQAVNTVLLHHDGLRVRMEKRDGKWTQYIVPPGDPTPLVWRDLSDQAKEEQPELISSLLLREFRSLSLKYGPVVKFIYIKRGGGETGLLCLFINHIIADGVSLDILGEDLLTVLTQLHRGQEIILLAKSTSLKTWTERVEASLHSGEWEEDLEQLIAYKRSWSPPSAKMLPLDYPEGKPDEKPSKVFSAFLSPQETAQLIKQAGRVWKVRLLDVIQAALVKTIAPWVGVSSLAMNVVVHGRDPVFEDIDLSRTIGFFTVGSLEVLDFKEDMRPVLSPLSDPHMLFAQILLNFSRSLERTYESDGSEKYVSFYDRYNPQVFVNFQGYSDSARQRLEQQKLFQPLPRNALHEIQEQAASKSLGCFSWVEQGKLCMDWSFSPQYFKLSTIEQLAKSYLKELRGFIMPN